MHGAKVTIDQIRKQPTPSEPQGSYCIPTQDEVKAVESLIRSSDELIAQLEADLSLARNFRAYQRTLIVPIRKLPNEVLGDIFAHVLTGTSIEIGRKSGTIWDLCEVCVRWRDVVESTPALWSNFKLAFLVDVKRSEVAPRVEKCLKLSGDTPLTIALLPVTIRSIPNKAINDIFGAANRWHSVTIYAEMFTLSGGNVGERVKHQGVGLLRELNVKKASGGNWISFMHRILRNPERLETLTMSGLVLLNFMDQLPSVRWFKIKKCIGSSFLVMISNVPNVEELTCIRHNFGPRNTGDPLIENVTLASLHTINVSAVEIDDSWSKLSIPQLTSFRLQNCLRKVHVLLQMIRGSSSVIKRLRMDFCNIETKMSVLRQLNQVEELTISLMPSYEGLNLLFLALIWDQKKPDVIEQLVPSLRTLVFNIIKENEDPTIPFLIMSIMNSRSARIVSKLIENRRRAPVPLLKLRCNIQTSASYPPSTDFIYAYSATLKRAGKQGGIDVEVVIKTATGDVVSDTAAEDDGMKREIDDSDVEMDNDWNDIYPDKHRQNMRMEQGSRSGYSVDYEFGEAGAITSDEDFDEDDILEVDT